MKPRKAVHGPFALWDQYHIDISVFKAINLSILVEIKYSYEAIGPNNRQYIIQPATDMHEIFAYIENFIMPGE